jgi:hypothetical protein
VITSPFFFFATGEVISLLGTTPVFADIDAKTYNINPDEIEKAIGKVRSEGKLKLRGIIYALITEAKVYEETVITRMPEKVRNRRLHSLQKQAEKPGMRLVTA